VTETRYGVLLPHFGAQARRSRLVEDSARIEAYGFDSVWVRDHVVFVPHSYEDQDRTHLDPLVVLSAIAAVTQRISLGTATLIPHRHPIHTAGALGALDFIAGPGRVIVGVGLGVGGYEFDSIGMGAWDRADLVEEQVQVMKGLWSGLPYSHSGKYYDFTDVQIRPTPPSGGLPVWYGGNSYAAARRAVEYCEGWLPARMPQFALRRRLQRLQETAELHKVPLPTVGAIPYVVPGKTVEEAEKYVNSDEFLAMATRSFGPPPGKTEYSTLSDTDGAVIFGPPDVIVEAVTKYIAVGVDEFIFDMRVRFDAWEEVLGTIGQDVLPQLRRLGAQRL